VRKLECDALFSVSRHRKPKEHIFLTIYRGKHPLPYLHQVETYAMDQWNLKPPTQLRSPNGGLENICSNSILQPSQATSMLTVAFSPQENRVGSCDCQPSSNFSCLIFSFSGRNATVPISAIRWGRVFQLRILMCSGVVVFHI
jgi:hypothetical protein